MNNEQNQPFNNSPVTEPVQLQTPTPEPVQPQTPTPEPVVKKKHTGLIATIIIVVIILLSGIAFAVFAIMKNSPTNIVLESVNNLLNADQVAANGEFNLSLKNLEYTNIESVNLNLDIERAQSNQQAEANLKINFTDGTSTATLSFGEIMLRDGVFYLHTDGVYKLYQDFFRDLLSSEIEYSISSQYAQKNTTTINSCNNSDSDLYTLYCILDNTSESETANNDEIAQKTAKVLTQIDEIIAKIDNQWFEFSIEDILNDGFFEKMIPISNNTRQEITTSYNCSIKFFNQIPKYVNSLSDLYNTYPFVELNPAQDNYYNISINASNFANYSNNAIYYSDARKDLSECMGTNYTIDDEYENETISVEDIEKDLKNFPNIAVRFSGFLNHHLTDIKINQTTDYFELSSYINLTYPSNLQASAPEDSQPIMEFIEEVYTKITDIREKYLLQM